MKISNNNLLVPKSFQSCVIGKRKMTNDEIPSNDILTLTNICLTEPSQMTTIAKEDNVKDFNDDNIGTEMNR